MAARVQLAVTLFLIGCELALCCWNSSDGHLGLTMLTKYNISLDAETVLRGPIYQLGEFKECIYTEQKQYCLAAVRIYPKDKHSSFWSGLQERMKYRTTFRRDKLMVGLCVSELCDTSNIESAFVQKLNPSASALGVYVNVSVEANYCQSKPRSSYTVLDFVIGAMCLVVISIVLAATVYEYTMVVTKEDGKDMNPVLCFSIITNWRRLTSPSKLKTLRAIQPMRILLLYFMVLGHELFIMITTAVQNPEKVERSCSELHWMLFFNGHLLVSVYFVISGFILGYMCTVNLVQHGFTFHNYFKSILLRYIRLTPAYAVIIALSCTWFSYLGSGPLWYAVYGSEVENCRQFWWLNLLYLNNYIHGDKPCMQHSWYLAADYQNFIVASLVLALVNKYKAWDKAIFGAVFFISVAVPALQTYLEQLNPMLLTYPETLRNIFQDRTYLRNYLTFHHNASPYFIGVITGYIFYKISISGTKLSKLVVAVMWSIAVTVPWAILLAGYIFFLPSYTYDIVVASVYAGLYRAVFAFAMGNILLLFTLGYAWIFNSITSWKLFQILGRLTYCAYLVHLSIIRMEVAAEKYPIHLSEYFATQRALTDVVLSFVGGLLLCVFVELPSSALLKTLNNVIVKDHQKNAII